jgi:ABC-type nitrate/sulfonate/bicarbonate transport system substrate-binding protein
MRVGSRSRRLAGAGIVLALSVVVAGCSSGSSSASSSSGSTAESVGSLIVGVPGVSTVSTALYIAQTEGYYAKYHVSVSLENAGALVGTEASAGRLDLAQEGTSGALTATAGGRPTSVVYWLGGNDTGYVVVRQQSPLKPAATALDTLMVLSGKRVAVEGTADSSYGFASAYSKYIVAHGGKPLTIVSLPTTAAEQAELLSGEVDAAVGSTGAVGGSTIAAGKARVLVAPSASDISTLSGGQTVALALWGLKSIVQSKSAAVAAFLAAVRDAQKFMSSHSAEQVAASLEKSSAWNTFTEAQIMDTYKYDSPFLGPSNGYIDSSVWARSVKSFGTWGLTINLNSSEFTYSNAVDMSYWNAATKLMNG